ncbi:serine protease inhibitor Kazal-type 1-like [Drosophila elegans]|uniref:serine protease inhibitor Kazal-type 1-like n=1 Tax=Drosophila elegans TaxID=30023 RepID=UPI0007E83BDA|nr:serine protease inhibitor Kazal-type 1-like [Drosophila elegans]
MRCLALIALCLFALLTLTAAYCPCPRIYDPVCGSNSITYSNQCVLECIAKVLGRVITVAKKGKC